MKKVLNLTLTIGATALATLALSGQLNYSKWWDAAESAWLTKKQPAEVAKVVPVKEVVRAPKRILGYAKVMKSQSISKELAVTIRHHGFPCESTVFTVNTGRRGNDEIVDVVCDKGYYQVINPRTHSTQVVEIL